ncbi:MAG TPA: AI-2E family transporter [Gemmatimonadaceae bacterium]|nr:AI-2E family transporter [Gemmatimonadaceae bacterium]
MPLPPLTQILVAAAGAIAVLAGMRAAAPILGPIFIALVITIAWSPASQWLRRRGWRPSIAALTGIVLGIAVMALFGGLVWASLIQLQDKLPGYAPRIAAIQDLIRAKLSDLPFDTRGVFSSEVVQPAAIVGYGLTTIRRISETAGTIVLLMLLMAFMMLEAMRFPAKLRAALRARREGEGVRFTQFGESIRSYVTINAIFGAIAAVINTILLLALGVDFAILWGVLSFLLSFLPNIGFIIAMVPPAAMALVEYGFTRSIIVVVAYVIINFIVDNGIKPRFVGAQVNLSPLVVVLSLVFWGWLLGPMGALVAVPLSIAAKFFLESFDESRWIAQLMSDAGEPEPLKADPGADA